MVQISQSNSSNDELVLQSDMTAAIAAAIAGVTPGIDILNLNVHDVALVAMGNADYTMTDTESQSAVIVVTGVGDGTKTLTWPTSSVGKFPAAGQIFATVFALKPVTIAYQGGGATARIVEGTVNSVSITSTFGAIHLDDYVAADARGSSNGIVTAAAGTTVLTDAMHGQLIVFNDAAPQLFTMTSGLITQNLIVYVQCTGAGGVTSQSDGTSTLVGDNPVLAAPGNYKIYRNDLTDEFRIVG